MKKYVNNIKELLKLIKFKVLLNRLIERLIKYVNRSKIKRNRLNKKIIRKYKSVLINWFKKLKEEI